MRGSWKKTAVWVAAAVAVVGLGLPGKTPESWSAWGQDVWRIVARADSGRLPETKRAARQNTAGSEYRGQVVSVHDGDTVRVRDASGYEHKIRFAFIDAPELNQASGIAARDALRKKIADREAEIRLTDIDRYGREVAVVRVGGEDINLWLVAQGLAWHYIAYAKKQQSAGDFSRYEQAQTDAKQKRRGLWHKDGAVAPWEFRRNERQHR